MTLHTRKIGNDNVSAIGFGAMGIGGAAYGEADSDEGRFKILDGLIELGCTFWDSADVYRGSSGKYFVHNPSARSKVFLATKFGFRFKSYTEFTMCGTPEYVHEACASSLKKLGVNTIDLYFQHRVDKTVPIEKTVGAMAELIKQGKIRYIGLSEPSPDTLRRAHAVHPIAAIQVEYSPVNLNIEKKGHLLDTARELGVTVVAYSPLGRGMLTGQYKSWADFSDDDCRKILPKFSIQNFPIFLDMVQEIQRIAETHKATTGQIAIAWLLAQGKDIIPIPGSKKLKYVEENIAAITTELSADEVAEIRRVVEAADIPGGEYDDASLALLVYGDSPALA